MKKNKHLEKLILNFLNFKPILPGAVTKQYKTCGKPNCRCMDKDNPQKHPSFQFSYTLENKKSTVYVKKSEVEIARKMTDSYKNLRKIITDITLESVKITRGSSTSHTGLIAVLMGVKICFNLKYSDLHS